MKKAVSTIFAVCAAACLCACGAVTVTTTTTTTTTDENGNKETTTTTTVTASYPEGSCGEAAMDTQEHDVPVTIVNNTGDDMTGLYVCVTGATEWSNLFEEGQVLADGDELEYYLTLTYTLDDMSFDLGLKGTDGELAEFDPIDISELSAYGIVITFTADGWTATSVQI